MPKQHSEQDIFRLYPPRSLNSKTAAAFCASFSVSTAAKQRGWTESGALDLCLSHTAGIVWG